MDLFTFKHAVPVWQNGMDTEMNHSLIFKTVIYGNSDTKLFIAAHSRYQIFLNGKFFAAGPARAAHGYYRVDEYSLDGKLSDGTTVVSVIVAGYNVNSYYLLDKPSFLCCEIVRGSLVIAATGRSGFEAVHFDSRIKKAPRYSTQRPFTEVYALGKDYDSFLKSAETGDSSVELIETEHKNFIKRNSPYCNYTRIPYDSAVSDFELAICENRRIYKGGSLICIGDTIKGFKENELESLPINEFFAYDMKVKACENKSGKFCLSERKGTIFDMGRNLTGYIDFRINCKSDTVIYAVFNELLQSDGTLNAGRNACENIIKWELCGGREYTLTSFEPYTFRYIAFSVKRGDAEICEVSVLEEAYPEDKIVKARIDGEALGKIYDAAVETFRQNTTDIFMDCPSRERGGWLCDSFFTSRTEYLLTGKSLVEHDFLENFLLAEKFDNIPDGMLPMCYPADHYDGGYIHNWAFWFVLELAEYLERTGDRELIDNARNRVYKLLEFSEKFENEFGLIENMSGWVFVEWSKANDFVQDVNFPSNMLYSKVLKTAAELYSDNSFYEKSVRIKKTVKDMSFNGEFFIDNAVRQDGRLVLTDNISETCQYYALFCDIATPLGDKEFFDKMMRDFGSVRDKTNLYPEVHKSNAFVGNYLRLDIMLREKMHKELLSDIENFFLPMAEKTGTLWENMTDSASCCHGFASYVANLLTEALETSRK